MESLTKRKLFKRYKLSVKISTCATRVNMAATGQEKIIVIQIPQNIFPWKGFMLLFSGHTVSFYSISPYL